MTKTFCGSTAPLSYFLDLRLPQKPKEARRYKNERRMEPPIACPRAREYAATREGDFRHSDAHRFTRQKSATYRDLGNLLQRKASPWPPTSLNARNASPPQRGKAKIKLQQTSATIGVSG
jgi:hypothetical protein